MSGSDQPRIIIGELAVDDRGEVGFVNDFDFTGVRRFYTVSNHRQGFIRAWHAHARESKFVTAVQGAALVAAVRVTDWNNPPRDVPVSRFVLTAAKPSVLYIPPGYANGSMSLTADSKLVYFSTATLEDSRNDDVRFDARYWDVWHVEER